ncbi:hypothetical protein EGR_09335 [Echinococcus granulosus]|uniref:Uncharacterized protein n=1 Tax=Echinococcus granulosus TaxID=6210 RepID=W6UQW6_ECHGR|nr:hypothetical protein EGR_09335 [Echinococcus granulosus]EUB55819.1 hypothetical protein EGR_09335 [Echinococcus granulosus]
MISDLQAQILSYFALFSHLQLHRNDWKQSLNTSLTNDQDHFTPLFKTSTLKRQIKQLKATNFNKDEHPQTRVNTANPTIASTVEITIETIKVIWLSNGKDNKRSKRIKTSKFSKIINIFKKRPVVKNSTIISEIKTKNFVIIINKCYNEYSFKKTKDSLIIHAVYKDMEIFWVDEVLYCSLSSLKKLTRIIASSFEIAVYITCHVAIKAIVSSAFVE